VRDEDGNIITDANVYVDFGFYRAAVGDTTLPVELSSFTASLTAQYSVMLTWVTQSETGLYGFKLYRSESVDVYSAYLITPIIINATNTSQATTYTFIDNEVANNTTYYYWLEIVEIDETSSFYGPTSIFVEGNDIPDIPTQCVMGVAYCNPFGSNSACTIPCSIPLGVSTKLYIKSLTSGVLKYYHLAPGYHNIYWNGRDSLGINVCGGVYQVQLIAKNPEGNTVFDQTQNILLYDIEHENEPVVRSSTTGYKISYQKYFQFGATIPHTGVNQEHYGDYVIPQQFKLVVTKPGYQSVEKQINILYLHVSQQEDIVLQSSQKRK
jgi:hypothetical protein